MKLRAVEGEGLAFASRDGALAWLEGGGDITFFLKASMKLSVEKLVGTKEARKNVLS